MRIAEINTVTYGSTGKIMLQIAEKARCNSYDVKTFSPVLAGRRKGRLPKIADHFYFGSWFSNSINSVIERFTGYQNCFSLSSTRGLLKQLKEFSPDIIHLHNLHSTYIDLGKLFNYIKKNGIKVVWTLHDCWAFTGKCPHFTYSKCDKWLTTCKNCPSCSEYPKSYFDKTEKMHKLKKEWFSNINDMTIVTPSEWLAGLVKQSFLKEYPVRVINNGIDLSVFRPTESDFRKKYDCVDKFIILGVAYWWGPKKGLDVFSELACRLDDRFRIVLVGTDETIDKNLPKNIISINRTHDQLELAQIYSAADLFVNPTREDNYPTVNMESIACATPVVTFKTGGSPEIIDSTCGSVVDSGSIDDIEKEIMRIFSDLPYGKEACLKKAGSFDMNNRFSEYIDLYKSFS